MTQDVLLIILAYFISLFEEFHCHFFVILCDWKIIIHKQTCKTNLSIVVFVYKCNLIIDECCYLVSFGQLLFIFRKCFIVCILFSIEFFDAFLKGEGDFAIEECY